MPEPRYANSTRHWSGAIKEETQERLQIWNVCQDLLVITDLEGKFLKVNPAWTATLGWHEFELLGKSSQWMLHPDDRKQALAETERLAAGQILHRFGVRFREKNGSYRWLSWRAVPHQGRIARHGPGRNGTKAR